MKNKLYILLIICGAAIFAFYTNFTNHKESHLQNFPDMNLVSIYNNEPINTKIHDKYIIQLFATWCTKCNEYNQDLLKILESNNFPFPIFGIAIKDKNEFIQKLYPKHNSPFNDIANDTRGFVLAELGIRSIPENIFVKNNIIVKRKLGSISIKELLDFSND